MYKRNASVALPRRQKLTLLLVSLKQVSSVQYGVVTMWL